MSVVYLLMGVAGSGKTTVGRALAARLGLPFHDADAFHPAANLAKMARGEALDDADRAPWLARLAALLAEWQAQGGAVLACSALKAAYRQQLLRDLAPETWRLVHLHADRRTLEQRLRSRQGHFFPPGLLDSQLQALEEPADGLRVDATQPLDTIVGNILDNG